jgi:hypothetical protein
VWVAGIHFTGSAANYPSLIAAHTPFPHARCAFMQMLPSIQICFRTCASLVFACAAPPSEWIRWRGCLSLRMPPYGVPAKAARNLAAFLNHVEWPKRKVSPLRITPFLVGSYGTDQISPFPARSRPEQDSVNRGGPVPRSDAISLSSPKIPSCSCALRQPLWRQIVCAKIPRMRSPEGGLPHAGDSQEFTRFRFRRRGAVRHRSPKMVFLPRRSRTNASREGLRLDGFLLRFSDPSSLTKRQCRRKD